MATEPGLGALSLAQALLSWPHRPTATYRAIELHVPNAWLGVLAATFAVVPLALALPRAPSPTVSGSAASPSPAGSC